MNRISGKPLKTRDSGTLGVAGIPCLFLELCQGNMRTADVNSHSGHKSDPSVAVLTPAAKGLTPVVTVLTPPLVQLQGWNGDTDLSAENLCNLLKIIRFDGMLLSKFPQIY